ncbi:50S ribosomal protein L10 [candidate division KSB1 bacterium]|nr:50S ribosomal protein L10 [candidate division KSB1 bacterium]
MPRPDKEQKVTEITEKISEAKSILLTDYKGLDVEKISDLRSQLREASVEYKIVKNTLTKISVENLGYKELIEFLDGPTAIAFGLDDPIAPAKIISDFAKKNDRPQIKAYFLDGQLYKGKEVDELAKLPTQEVLLGQLVGTISAPLSNFVYLLNNLLQKTVFVLSAIKEKKEQEG